MKAISNPKQGGRGAGDEAMMIMQKIGIAKIEAAARGRRVDA
jgi:hypothetical protein